MRERGFTLVELVMVIMLTGILAASLTIFLKPAIESYLDTRRRADLTDMADTALRRMGMDIRRAVANSVRPVDERCFRLVPTIAGGRYRMAADIVNDTPAPLPCAPSATCSAPLDPTRRVTSFDVLSPLAVLPAVGDWVVIGNQNGNDVYLGVNRGRIAAAPTAPRDGDGLHRLTVDATAFPAGYEGGRFVVVPADEPTVFYSCVGNTLYRSVAPFGADPAAQCASLAGAVAATDVAACSFVHNPNQGATQQSGFVWMRLELARDGERVVLAHGVHVVNVP